MSINVLKLREKDISKKIIWILFIVLSVFLLAYSIASGKIIYSCAIVVPLFIYLCIKNPFVFPFGAYAFLLPFDNLLSVTGNAQGATLTKFLAILTILVLLVKGLFEKKLKRPDKATIYWIMFILYGALSMFWATDPSLVRGQLITAAGLLVLYLITASYKLQKSEFSTLKWFILVGGFLSAILAIYFYLADAFESSQRATLAMGERTTDPNVFAFSLLIPISICIENFLNQKKKVMKGLFIILLSIIAFSIIISGSRGGLLGVAVVFIVYILFLRRRLSFGIILLIIGIILFSLTPDYFVERWGEAKETGGAGRITIWITGLKALEDYWSIGAGLNNFPRIYFEYARFTPFSGILNRATHNIYLQILVELGIVGFLIMLVGIKQHYQAVRTHFALSDSDQVMLKAAFWAIMVSSFFLGTLWLKSFWLMWMMIMMHHNLMKSEPSLLYTSKIL